MEAKTAVRIGAKEAGPFIRAALKKAFPSTKFSVTMSRGTAWGNYTIKWTDGPTTKRVEDVVRPFENKGFDASTDCPTYRNEPVEIDGTVYKFSTGLVLYNRTVTPELREKAKARVTKYFGESIPSWELDRYVYRSLEDATLFVPEAK